jgi:aspartyl protease family protein
MGFVYVDVGVSNPSTPDVSENVRALADTGATLSILPTSLLEGLGIRRIGKKKVRGLGGVVTRDVGNVTMHYYGVAGGVTTIFGEKDDPAIMGVTALESLGFDVDPVTGKLKSVEMLML